VGVKPVLFFLLSAVLGATEISTGSMLGRKYDPRAFYIRGGPGDSWQKTYSGRAYRREAQGKLMNLRLAQALFHDEWMDEQPFDPDRNTDAVIEALDFYKSHGVLMIAVSLQGGQAGYDMAVNGVDRKNGYRYGREEGTHVSAFHPDGSLKADWLNRLERLVRAADARGMVVNIMYFYQGQDELFESTRAMHDAARNITDWLIEKKLRNVIVDVANEYDLGGAGWDFDRYIPQHILMFIDEIRSRFSQRRADFLLPVTASSDGRMRYPQSLIGASDIVLIHGNGRSVAEKTRRTAELKPVSRPVLMNEDDNGRASTAENLAQELASCDILFKEAAGWGYMPWIQAQRFPFRWLPGREARVRDDMPEKERDMAYFHAVLDHIAGLVMRRPPPHQEGK
jgi:hypothetical protein